jgi:putative transposase
MTAIDLLYTEYPFFGTRRLEIFLKKQGFSVGRKRVRRLMQLMGIVAIYPHRNTSVPHPAHRVYPYLLRDVRIERPNHVWSTDITFIRLAKGFAYLVAVLDWHSRYVRSWRLSNTMETSFCIEALEEALRDCQPTIFNSDQGSQFTSTAFTQTLERRAITISMDGRGRAYDNIFIERLWRSVKYEDVYIKQYATIPEAHAGLIRYFEFYNTVRPHQALGYKTPAQVYFGIAP